MTLARIAVFSLLWIDTIVLTAEITSEPSFGKSFVVFFPENIAYYYPVQAENAIHVTALYSSTTVTITNGLTYSSATMNAGDTRPFNIPSDRELKKEEMSDNPTLITSNFDIVIQAISHKNNSIQIVPLLPTDKFGRKFFIPQRLASSIQVVSKEVTERNPMRLICVSGSEEAKVTVKGSSSQEVRIKPNNVAQIWLDDSDSEVESDKPVGVFISHPCLLQKDCVCGLLYTMIPPVKGQELNFIIPPGLVDSAQESSVIIADGKDTVYEKFDPNAPLVKSKGTVFLQRPGLLLPLVTEQDFASCYAISAFPLLTRSVVIVVHKDKKAGVQVGSESQEGSNWDDLAGTDYTSTVVSLVDGKSVIWHKDATIAVYFMVEKNGFQSWSVAPVISNTPDFRGCAIEPEVFVMGEAADGWRESLQYCRDLGMDLICFTSEEHRLYVNKWIKETSSKEVTDVWIGMRRSAFTGNWYWVSGCEVVETSWAEDEPGTMKDGQCVMMNLKEDQEFTWRDEECCVAAQPVCGSRLMLFPL